jgi:hypothetical protein
MCSIVAAPDSAQAPFHLSVLAGPELVKIEPSNFWFETSVQLEFKTLAMLRYGYSIPLVDRKNNSSLEAADLQRYSHTISLAKEWRKNNHWCAVGGGWSWMRFDTTERYDDPRSVLVENGSGLQLLTTSSPGMWGGTEVPDHIGWKWAVPVEKRSPYLFVEVGNGWQFLSGGMRAEYRFGFGVGMFVRLRIPTLSGSNGSTDG